jgi:cytochrome b6-f complex iron-sulfur subunit
MKRSSQLVVIDRRYVLRGMAATLAATFMGCRISLDSSPQPGSTTTGGVSEPDGGTPMGSGSSTGSGSGSGSGSDAGTSMCGGDVCLDLSAPENAALQSVDGARVLTVNGHQILVVRIDAATFAALSAVCTHAGCIVNYAPGGHDVECPCHGSLFGTDGHVIRGPAELPLASYQTAFDDTAQMLTITI